MVHSLLGPDTLLRPQLLATRSTQVAAVSSHLVAPRVPYFLLPSLIYDFEMEKPGLVTQMQLLKLDGGGGLFAKSCLTLSVP